MKFDANEDVVLEMARLAVNAAVPVGMGFLHAEQKDYAVDDVRPCLRPRGLEIDYFRGRMIKLRIRRNDDGSWEMDGDPCRGYQSWVSRYPSNEALLEAARGSAGAGPASNAGKPGGGGRPVRLRRLQR